MNDHQLPVILGPGAGREISVGHATLWLKLASEATAGRMSVTEYVLPPWFAGSPAHKHHTFEHAWYVLDGSLTVQLDTDTLVLEAGGFIFIPKTMVHAFSNGSDAMVKVLVVDTPGGFEKYYDDLEAAFGGGQAIDHQLMRDIQLKYDTYPPDYIF